jgi:hypothetical protein
MPNFEIKFQMAVKEWRGQKTYKTFGKLTRVLVASDRDLMEKIAWAMIGESLYDVLGFRVLDHRNPEPEIEIVINTKCEIAIAEVLSINETQKETDLALSKGAHPIPNDQYICCRVLDKLKWH